MLILGAGSQARVLADLVLTLGGRTVHGFVELGMNPALIGTRMLDLPVLGGIDDIDSIIRNTGALEAALGYGDNRLRSDLLDMAKARGLKVPPLVHPHATVSRFARLGEGVFVAAQAFVGTEAEIGDGCIINTTASVDHNCVLGRCVSVAVGAHLCGAVTVGDLTAIGVGAVVVPKIRIGSRVTVGAGAAVVRDLSDSITAIGVPARPVER